MNPKEERELCAELDALGFRWERTRNGHIKAFAPDGKTFTFSTGGQYRAQLNQRQRLRRWKNEQQQEPLFEVPEPEPEDDIDEWSMTILEEMTPGQIFITLDVSNKTDLTKDQAAKAIEYLVDEEMLIKRDGGYVIPEEEEAVVVPLSTVAIAAIEAMVEAVRLELAGDDAETYKLANEAFRSENAKLSQEILDANGEVNGLLTRARKDADTISQLHADIEKKSAFIKKQEEQVKALREENGKLQIVVKKYNDLRKLFT